MPKGSFFANLSGHLKANGRKNGNRVQSSV